MNCSHSPLRPLHPAIYVTNAVIVPLLFGIGVLGNLVTIVIFNRSYIRVQNSMFVFLTGLAVVDLLTLLVVAPGCLHDMGALSTELGHSKLMARYSTLSYGLYNILKHTSIWTLAFVALVRHIRTVYHKQRLRWTKISTSRVIMFILVLFCILVDFPRFFERKLVLKTGHCFIKLELWTWDYTEFGKEPLLTQIYPWLILATCFALPYLLMFLFTTFIAVRIRLWRIINRDWKSSSLADDEVQGSLVLVTVILVFIILEIPDSIAYILQDVWRLQPKSNSFAAYVFVSHCFSLIRSSVNFIIYCLLSKDFRKTFRRTFCCSCILGDDYYEPIRCSCLCCQGDKDFDDDQSMQKSRRSSKKKSTDANTGVMWI